MVLLGLANICTMWANFTLARKSKLYFDGLFNPIFFRTLLSFSLLIVADALFLYNLINSYWK